MNKFDLRAEMLMTHLTTAPTFPDKNNIVTNDIKLGHAMGVTSQQIRKYVKKLVSENRIQTKVLRTKLGNSWFVRRQIKVVP